ncbi:MAG TPA: hypothetical protein VJN50_01775 [Actinomycetota bacterium]|nr:hypothetical protein [Actinomycetota bacterium]
MQRTTSELADLSDEELETLRDGLAHDVRTGDADVRARLENAEDEIARRQRESEREAAASQEGERRLEDAKKIETATASWTGARSSTSIGGC